MNSTCTNIVSDFDIKSYEELVSIIKPPTENFLGVIVTDKYGTNDGHKIYNPKDIDVPEFYFLLTESSWNNIKESTVVLESTTINFLSGVPVFVGDDVAQGIIGERWGLFLVNREQLRLINDMKGKSVLRRYFSTGV